MKALTILFLVISLLCLSNAVNQKKKHASDDSEPNFLQLQAVIESEEEGCCEVEEVNECEVELLENYRQIDINRQVEMTKREDVTYVRFTVTLDIPEGSTFSQACREQFKSSLSFITDAEEVIPVQYSEWLDIIAQSYNNYVFEIRLVDVPEIKHHQVDNGVTDVVKFLVQVQKYANEETIRKHIFRSYVRVNDNIVDEQIVTGQVKKTKIYTSDEQCPVMTITDEMNEEWRW